MRVSFSPQRFRWVQSSRFLIVLLLAFSGEVQAQVTRLSFRPVDAAYSRSLNKIIAISDQPDQLHIYDVASGSDRIVALQGSPFRLTLSPDQKHAAVTIPDSINYINLETATVEKLFLNVAKQTEPVLVSDDYIWTFTSNYDDLMALEINGSNGYGSIQAGFKDGVYVPQQNAIYFTTTGNTGSLMRYSLSGPNVTSTTSQPSFYAAAFQVCGPFVASADGSRIVTGCGAVYQSSDKADQDMKYLGTLEGIETSTSAAVSQGLNRIAAIPTPYGDPINPVVDNQVHLFDGTTFAPVGVFFTTSFLANNLSYVAHGRWVFFDDSSSFLLVITQADAKASLLQDFALERIDLKKGQSCQAQFGNDGSLSVRGAGSLVTVPILSSTDCVFTATSNASWITIASGGYGSGDTSLELLVRPNLSSSARTGTVSLGSETLTVTQNGPESTPSLNHPLSVRIVAAEYDKVLDRIVMVSDRPSELHLYDPVTQADGIVALDSTPLSVSVRPDGLFAAVGHKGHISLVDLSSMQVTKTIPVDFDCAGIVLASNGYAYVFPVFSGTNTVIAIRLSDGNLTDTTITSPSSFAHLQPSLPYIYTGRYSFDKLDISSGVAYAAEENFYSQGFGGNFWFSEDGRRIIDASASALLTSDNNATDLSPNGNLSGAGGVDWAADSQIRQQTAVLTSVNISRNALLQIYADDGLALQRQTELPGFTTSAGPYLSQGRYVFWNRDATKLFAITQAEDRAGLLSPFALQIVNMPESLPLCTYSVDPTELFVPPTSSVWSFNVQSACNWQVNIPIQFREFLSSNSGSGSPNGNGGFSIYSNEGEARDAYLTVGTATLVVHQAPATCSYSISPFHLSFNQAGGSEAVTLQTGAGCSWSIQNPATWVHLREKLSGTGTTVIHVSVDPEASLTGNQSAYLNVAGQQLIVDQNRIPVSSALNFVPVTPCRVTDTRLPDGPFGGPFLPALTDRAFVIAPSPCNIPYGAVAYSLNITVVPHGTLGFLTAWPSGQTRPFVSTLNSMDGRVKANAAIVGAGVNQAISLYATNDTDVVLDINGYFVDATTGKGLEFFPVTPCRVADTRLSTGPFGGPSLVGEATREFAPPQSSCNLDSAAGAYSLNFTAVPGAGPLGYLAAWPSEEDKPFVSTLNASSQVTANAALVPAGADGGIDVYVTNSSNLVVDTNGYFAAPGAGGLHFYTVPPCRVLDTRISGDYAPFTGVQAVAIAGMCNLPAQASAAVFNITVIPVNTLGYLTLWPQGEVQPFVSTLNSMDGAVTSNMAIVPLQNGAIDAFTTEATHLVLDVTGYFAP
ncbi:MAG: BACON domain-containing protein [Rhodospirillales bacterium]|nr:BACON domain-containing protein [Acetobacter sp.]